MGLTVLLASAVHAQDGAPRRAPIQWGPVGVTPSLELTQLGVDTNVFNSSENPRSDFTMAGGPRVDFGLPMRRFTLQTRTYTEFVYFHTFSNQRSVNFDATMRGDLDLTRVRPFVEVGYLNTRQRPNQEIDARARRTRGDLRGGVSVVFSRKLSFEVAGVGTSRAYVGDDPLSDRLGSTLDADTLGGEATLRYALTPLTSIEVKGTTLDEDFVTATDRDHRSWSVVPAIEFQPRAVISGRAEVGYRRILGQRASLPDFSGPVASVDLSYRLLGSSVLGFTAGRNVEFSVSLVEPYYVATTYGASWRYQLTQRYAVRAGAQRYTYAYVPFETDVTDSLTGDRTDRTMRYSLTFFRRLSRTTEIGFDVSHYARRSTRSDQRRYEGVVAGLTMGYAF